MGAQVSAAAVTSFPSKRRRKDQAPREKTSLSLRADVLDAARQLVSSGNAENLSAFVEMAVQEKIRRTKRAELFASYEAASNDPDFRERMSGIAGEFDASVADGI
jgi:hypothetical protein